jgi:hypothetical protein
MSDDRKHLKIFTGKELLAAPIPPRPSRGDDPIEYDSTPVRLRAEKLDRVLWQGRQWAVTDYGLECRDGTYCFEAARIAEHADTYGWPLHITQKNWADSDDFCTAWLVAIALHGIRIPKNNVRSAISRSYPPELRPATQSGTQQ